MSQFAHAEATQHPNSIITSIHMHVPHSCPSQRVVWPARCMSGSTLTCPATWRPSWDSAPARPHVRSEQQSVPTSAHTRSPLGYCGRKELRTARIISHDFFTSLTNVGENRAVKLASEPKRRNRKHSIQKFSKSLSLETQTQSGS